ncbi:MAG: YitT family protein [Actinobacteria bacterium]|nr:YitT family protein [Actinomycetota bacterium]
MSALSQWLKPSRTVPTTSWSASGSMWKAKPKTFFYLMLGNWLYGTGEAILIKADIGQSPGTVLAQGIQNITGDTIGWTSFYISIGVMFLWIPLKNKVGIGTVLNIIFVSVAIDVMMPFFPSPNSYAVSVVMVIIGILVIGLGSAFYIPSNLGPGPRDGLMTGLHYRTGIPIGRVRFVIEAVFLLAGWLLGGSVGLGTVLVTVLVGEVVAIFFGIVSRVSKPAA